MRIIASVQLLNLAKTSLSRDCVVGATPMAGRIRTRRFCSKHKTQALRTEVAQDYVPRKELIQFHGIWPTVEKLKFLNDMRILPEFITADEESQLMEEIEPYMKRLRYEYDHWDDAIHGFRETERKHWYPHNRLVLDRVCKVAFKGEAMPYVHILDLAEKGVIKPHVDSVRYCGNTISGLSLLTPCVMRLVRVDENMYKQPLESMAGKNTNLKSPKPEDAYRSRPQTTKEFYADLLLPRKSLYIMSNSARYNYTHEILANDESVFQGQHIEKMRRVSVICRNDPQNRASDVEDN